MDARVALITGGSRGLGREMALAFADDGLDVVVASRKLDACEAVADEVRARGRRALAVAAHMADWSAADALADRAYDAFGRVDVLVNNAGMSPLYEDLASVGEDLFDKTVGVNMKGPFRLAATIGTRMAAAGGGVIINVSSVTAAQPRPGELPYAMAKAAVETMTVGMAYAFGPTVRVNCIAPGMFLTDIAAAWDPVMVEAATAQFALRRAAEPHEIVGVARYLASDASTYTTGAVIRVDGGYR